MSLLFKYIVLALAIFNTSQAQMSLDKISALFNYKTDYDAAAVMNSLSMIFGSSMRLLTGTDDGPTIDQDVTFWCSNQQRQSNIQTFVNDTDMVNKINISKPITFIVHGWTDNGNRTWIKNMTNSKFQIFLICFHSNNDFIQITTHLLIQMFVLLTGIVLQTTSTQFPLDAIPNWLELTLESLSKVW